jgi:hypothetical protein
MSLRRVSLLVVFLLGCAGETMKVKKGEPQTAREKMLAEQKANPEEEGMSATGKKWGAWRYQGDRKDCFFVLGRKCYKTEKAACSAARCKATARCITEGAGPATVKCEAKS